MNQLPIIQAIRKPNCKRCDLYKQAKHVCLIGVGPIEAKIMFIGESPGLEEDHYGEPFVGKAGKLLNSILWQSDIKREDVFITNIIKCHPPHNTKPPIDNQETCSYHYLRKEIKLVQPDLIVCLGAMSSRFLSQNNHLKMEEVRGSVWYTKPPLPDGFPFICTYHPAGTFHFPELLGELVDDIEYAKRLLAGELPKPKRSTKYKQLDSIWKIPGLDKAKWIDLDLETDGLDAFIPGKEILSVQISVREGEAYYFDWNKKIRLQLRKLIGSSSHYSVNGHNIKFDLRWLRSKAKIIVRGKLNDTIQNIHMIDENFPHKGLETVSTSFTELKAHKGRFPKLINDYVKVHKEKKEPIGKARGRLWAEAFRSIPAKLRVEYGCGDADATGRLRTVFKPKLKELGLLPLHNLMMNTTKLYVDMECNGIKIDERLLPEYDKKYKKEIAKLEEMLDDVSPIEISHNAPLQVRKLLYSEWKLHPHEIRMGKKRVRYSTGKDALELLLKDNLYDDQREYITRLLEFRKLGKIYGTYVSGMPRYLRQGFIHANWNLTGTDTGRSSCNNPNLQQIPRTGDIKKLFISRYENGCLMQVDVSQGEPRIAAHMSNEPTLIKIFRSDSEDIYRTVAAEMLNKSVGKITDEERYKAKQTTLAIFYGSGAKTASEEMGTTEAETYALIKAWHKRFSRWKEYTEEVEEFVILNHYVRNLFGRYRHLFILDPLSDEGRTQLRQAVNAPIQGSLADYNRLCGVNVWKRITRNPYMPTLFVGEGHDAWLLDMPKELIPRVATITKEEFENPDTSAFGFEFKVPMKVEIKVGPNWKEMEEYES